LFLLLGYASNQVNTLWKLVIVLTDNTQDDPVKQRLEGAQTQIFVWLTIGAMREALKLVEKLFLQSPLGKEFVPLLDQQVSASLERLKKRFGKLDMLVVIRDHRAVEGMSLAGRWMR
jgi:hypothetical protein